MPQPLQSTLDSAREHAHVVKIAKERKERIARMRDITKSVESSACIPRDTTHNADSVKSRNRDKLSRHTPDVTRVLSDTRVLLGDKLVAVKRSHSRAIVRDENGQPNREDTLALADRLESYRASNRRSQ